MSAVPKPTTKQQRSDWAYVLGIAGVSVTDTVLQLWLIFFFVPPPDRGITLVSPQTFGLAILLGRLAEALANPVAGFVSDRLGRPQWFLLGGALAFGLSSALLFLLPTPGESERNTILLFGLLIVALIGQACYGIPYLGLLPRVAPDGARRLKITSLQALFILLGVFAGQVASGGVLKLLNNDLALTVTLFFGAALSLMLIPLTMLRDVDAPANANRFSLGEIFAVLRRNPGFRAIITAQALFWLGFNMVRSVVVYYVTVLLRRPETEVAIYLGSIFLVTLPSLLLVRYLVARIGKRRMMMVATGMFAVLLPLLSTIGSSVGPLSAQNWALLLLSLSGFPLAVFSAVPNPMVAEEVDRDTLATGISKGALFFGLQGLTVKISVGLAGALLGYLLANFGYSQTQPLGIQLVGPIAGVLALGATVAYSFYPRDEPAQQGKAQV